MSQGLGKIARSYIEDKALKTQEILTIKCEPNVYEYTSVKALLESINVWLEFDVNLSDTNNSMQGSFEEKTLYTVLPFNVVKTYEGKILQFAVCDPSNLTIQEYLMFLRSVFWEYWGELKKTTEYCNIEFSYKSDYSLFSRAMVIPYNQFLTASIESTPNFPNSININKIADLFNVHYTLISGRIKDFNKNSGWILNG